MILMIKIVVFLNMSTYCLDIFLSVTFYFFTKHKYILKRPKYEKLVARIFTQFRPVWIGEL
jgi:hypothetical protein